MNMTGIKLKMMTDGECSPTPPRMKTAEIVAAREYAGATDETATAVASKRLSSSALSCADSSPSGTGAQMVLVPLD